MVSGCEAFIFKRNYVYLCAFDVVQCANKIKRNPMCNHTVILNKYNFNRVKYDCGLTQEPRMSFYKWYNNTKKLNVNVVDVGAAFILIILL